MDNRQTLGRVRILIYKAPRVGTEFGEGDVTKQKPLKRSAFSLNEGKAFSEWRLGQGMLRILSDNNSRILTAP